VAAAEAEKQALKATILSVFKEERPTVCFLCLGRNHTAVASELPPLIGSPPLFKFGVYCS
jgi:hypothetical protein